MIMCGTIVQWKDVVGSVTAIAGNELCVSSDCSDKVSRDEILDKSNGIRWAIAVAVNVLTTPVGSWDTYGDYCGNQYASRKPDKDDQNHRLRYMTEDGIVVVSLPEDTLKSLAGSDRQIRPFLAKAIITPNVNVVYAALDVDVISLGREVDVSLPMAITKTGGYRVAHLNEDDVSILRVQGANVLEFITRSDV